MKSSIQQLICTKGRICLLCVIVLNAVSCKQAQEPVSLFGDLSGMVTDFDSGEPISKAVITIGGGSSVTTGSDGYYIIDNMDPGNYNVEANAEGFSTSTRTITVKANYNTQCDFTLCATKGTISVSPLSAEFGTNLSVLQLIVKNTGKKALTVSSVAKDHWVSVSPSSFNLPTGSEASVSVSINRASFEYAADYSSSVEFSFDNSTFPVPVKCTASDEQVNGSLISSASELLFTKNDISKTFTITNNGQTPVSYQIEASSNCNTWVSSVSPTYGTMGVNASQEFLVFIDRAKILESGTVTGDMTISYASKAKQLSVRLRVDAQDAVIPEVSDVQVELSSHNSVLVTGELVSVGSHPVMDYGICYSPSPDPQIEDQDSKVVSLGNSSTAAHIEKTVSNLDNTKRYFFRLYARNAIGIVYSPTVSIDIPSNSGDIVGTITNSITKVPISQAMIEVAGNKVFSDEAGHYSVPAVQTGVHDIAVSASSYNSIKDIVTVSYAKSTTMNFELEPSIPKIVLSPSSLDFGADCDILTFSIENIGATVINFDIATSAFWVKSIVPSSGKLGVGGSSDVKVYISRDDFSETGTFESVLKVLSEAGEDYVGISVMSGVLTPPTVTMGKVVNVQYSSALFEMTLDKIGSSIVTELGVCISTKSVPTLDDLVFRKTGMFNIPSTFQIEAVNLEPNTQYYVRSYARSIAGLSYSTREFSLKTNATNNENVGGDGSGEDFYDNEW